MKSILVDITDKMSADSLNLMVLSFTKFIVFLRSRVDLETGFQKEVLQMVLDRILEDPAFSKPVYTDKVADYIDQLQLIYHTLVPSMKPEEGLLWGLSAPIDPLIFFVTDSLYDLLFDSVTETLKAHVVEGDLQQDIQRAYDIILENLYGISKSDSTDLIVCVNTETPGEKKYYRINIDSRFVQVSPKDKLPAIDHEAIKNKLQDPAGLEWLATMLPLDTFKFEGFSVLTATDVTQEHALEELREIILNRQDLDTGSYLSNITDALKTLAGDPTIDFGMMPLLKVNNKLVFNYNNWISSRIIKAALEYSNGEKAYLSLVKRYLNQPGYFVSNDLSQSEIDPDLVQVLKNSCILAAALLPVYHHGVFCGVFEVYSDRVNGINEIILARLNHAFELLGLIYQNTISEFNEEIEHVIRDKFTSLQPAVTWKFRDAAWHYLQDKAKKIPDVAIEPITFKGVYPLYGAVDIRNSTGERNVALKEDFNALFAVLIDTLSVLKQHLGLYLAGELIFKTRQMQAHLNDETTHTNELHLEEFLVNEIHPVLAHFSRKNLTGVNERKRMDTANNECSEEVFTSVEKYFEFTDKQTGQAFAHRHALEESMQTINSAVNQHLDIFKNQLQLSYPTFFDKFRTDGVEYDIYIGQSIDPETRYHDFYLKNIRLAQLKCMADIALVTNELLAGMEKKLPTTQLIFINAGTIDISFRDDERRFDVEGAYNIRYQIIKKRIDKVHIAGTQERLTQPGKIAMVYFSNSSIQEYIGYITYLQQQGTLLADLEYLDLEELQGVNGLKALRVGVNYVQTTLNEAQ
ncbi:GAF domain-containing protein [Dyadobacter sp. CY261]|uniref:GAF domain-containing protein n=1 Tax=Dyadobacter sp. CY261 TaxID=2907203 RepID=UPI001F3059AB|nr:GAF domain-containing protein [Dyadobacter sp. CY261]MCF0069648.1 GAF domain-containing protein [Dyadobacter sp. CY261]